MRIDLTEREIDFLKQYARVYDTERRCDITCEPIVVVEDIEEIITQSGYEDKEIYVWEESTYNSESELVEALKESDYCDSDIDEILVDLESSCEALDGEIRLVPVKVIYKPIAYFLTRTEAGRYCEYQKHNLRNPRVYTRNMGYSNRGDLKEFAEMLLRIGKELIK